MGFGKIILHQKGAVMNSFYFFSYLFRFVHFFLKFAPMGTSPLTRYRALPEPVLAGRQIREEVFYETLALMYGIALCDFNYDVTFGSSCIGEFRTVSVDR